MTEIGDVLEMRMRWRFLLSRTVHSFSNHGAQSHGTSIAKGGIITVMDELEKTTTRWMLFPLHLRRNHFHVVNQHRTLITVPFILSIRDPLLLHFYGHFMNPILKTGNYVLILFITQSNDSYDSVYFSQGLQLFCQSPTRQWAIPLSTAFLNSASFVAVCRMHYSDHPQSPLSHSNPHLSPFHDPYLHLYRCDFMFQVFNPCVKCLLL